MDQNKYLIYLPLALGSQSFVETYVLCKVSQWTDMVRQLLDIARTQPCAMRYAQNLLSRNLLDNHFFMLPPTERTKHDSTSVRRASGEIASDENFLI